MCKFANCIRRVRGTYDPADEVSSPSYGRGIDTILGEEGEDLGFFKVEMMLETSAESDCCVQNLAIGV
jgi:hypothetical protein